MHKTPFEKMLETALYSVGIELGKPIYRQELLLGKQADDVFKYAPQDVQEQKIMSRLFVSNADNGVEDTGSDITVRRREIDFGKAKLQYDIELCSSSALAKATPKDIEAHIKQAMETDARLAETVILFSPSKELSRTHKKILTALGAGLTEPSFTLTAEKTGYTWFDTEIIDAEKDSPEGLYDPNQMAAIVLSHVRKYAQ